MRCNKCDTVKPFVADEDTLICECGNKISFDNGILQYRKSVDAFNVSEMNVRDDQANQYLELDVLRMQTFRIKQFLGSLPDYVIKKPALDLGCGPGPSTNLFLQKGGYKVVAVDFSNKSLEVNKNLNANYSSNVLFVKANLNDIRFESESVFLIMMCDFLNHLGPAHVRNSFLKNAFASLSPKGYFYISILNFTLPMYFRRNLYGSYCNGKIVFERLFFNEVIDMFPDKIKIDAVIPMNIVNKNIFLDRLLVKFPGASYIAPIISIYGHKVG